MKNHHSCFMEEQKIFFASLQKPLVCQKLSEIKKMLSANTYFSRLWRQKNFQVNEWLIRTIFSQFIRIFSFLTKSCSIGKDHRKKIRNIEWNTYIISRAFSKSIKIFYFTVFSTEPNKNLTKYIFFFPSRVWQCQVKISGKTERRNHNS